MTTYRQSAAFLRRKGYAADAKIPAPEVASLLAEFSRDLLERQKRIHARAEELAEELRVPGNSSWIRRPAKNPRDIQRLMPQ